MNILVLIIVTINLKHNNKVETNSEVLARKLTKYEVRKSFYCGLKRKVTTPNYSSDLTTILTSTNPPTTTTTVTTTPIITTPTTTAREYTLTQTCNKGVLAEPTGNYIESILKLFSLNLCLT